MIHYFFLHFNMTPKQKSTLNQKSADFTKSTALQYLLHVIPGPHEILAHRHDIFLQRWCMQSRAATTTLQGEQNRMSPRCKKPPQPMTRHSIFTK